jgi:hypothetical protein
MRDYVPTLINKMFKIAEVRGMTYKKVLALKDNDWYRRWSWTEKQQSKWEIWGVLYLMDKLGMSRAAASSTMRYASFQWGLTTKEG